MGKFWRTVDTAIRLIHELEKTFCRPVEKINVERGGVFWLRVRQALKDGFAVSVDFVGLFTKNSRDFIENIDKGWTAVASGRRKVGSAPDRRGVGGKKHGQWPAALFAELVKGGHVDLIDFGSFFAIDLDVDEEAVHDRGSFLILKAFMGHNVAPVAGGVANRKEDWFVVPLGFLQRGKAPGAPMDGIVLVLEQIGTCFVFKKVLGHKLRRSENKPLVV